MMDKLQPQLTLIGDFHTHPFNSISEVGNKGYEFSDEGGDFDEFIQNDLLWEQSNHEPLMLVMTIAPLKKVHQTIGGDILRNNIWKFDVGDFRFWINACVGKIENGERTHSKNKHSKVFLDLNTRFFNESGERMD